MYYIIQKDLWKEEHYQTLLDAMQRYGLEYRIINFIPFINKMVEVDDSKKEVVVEQKDVFVFGSVPLTKSAGVYGWNPGVLYNENHDIEVYGKHYAENMLNHDGFVMNFIDPLPERLPYAFFARPTKDTKAFSGQCFTHDSWNEWVATCIREKVSDKLNSETKIQVASLKDTQQEVRCWVVGGKVITTSRYKLGSRVVYKNYDDEKPFVDFAQAMVDLYQPAEAFVLDVCLSNDQLYVVEINCINCSGLYHADMYKLITALENQFGK